MRWSRAADVRKGAKKSLFVVAQLAERGVTARAENPANTASYMIVIDMFILQALERTTTQGTHASLAVQKFSPAFHVEAVPGLRVMRSSCEFLVGLRVVPGVSPSRAGSAVARRREVGSAAT